MAVKRMNLKKRKRKRLKYKLIICLLFVYIGFAISFYYSFREKKVISNEEFINIIASGGNANILKEYKTISLVDKTMEFLFNIDFDNPSTILNTTIFKDNEENVKQISLEYNDDYSNMNELESISDYINDPNPTDIDNPIIYLYNSHQLENYNSENLDVYGITPNVLMASYILRENLNKLNINTIVEGSNMSDILKNNNWNYSYSYSASRIVLNDAMNKYTSLEYFIDIHRDSITHDYSTTTIGDKSYAKVMFVIGADHTNWNQNYNLVSSLNSLLNKYYPTISRGIIKKEGSGVNGIYNQDLSPNCILIEVGGVDNTIDEVSNTMLAISDILYKHIKGGE